MAAQQSLR
uniref:Uncharacterized protein n=1 Tax=Rhizophora mucronata TaxID=61149 RepID=A0A2P2R3X2_RHIMU